MRCIRIDCPWTLAEPYESPKVEVSWIFLGFFLVFPGFFLVFHSLQMFVSYRSSSPMFFAVFPRVLQAPGPCLNLLMSLHICILQRSRHIIGGKIFRNLTAQKHNCF